MLPELEIFPNLMPSIELIEKDADYIWDAYNRIESYWHNEFVRIEAVRVALLSEAPLFGDSGSYFNPDHKATQFFNYADFTEAIGPGLNTPRKAPVSAKKAELIAAMSKAGILVVDIFPFALNTRTEFSYSDLTAKEYAGLFEMTAPLYFRQKLKHVIKKMVPNGKFVFRYRRVQKAAEGMVRRELEAAGLDGSQLFDGHIGGRYGSLNRQALKNLYTGTIASARQASQ